MDPTRRLSYSASPGMRNPQRIPVTLRHNEMPRDWENVIVTTGPVHYTGVLFHNILQQVTLAGQKDIVRYATNFVIKRFAISIVACRIKVN